MADSKEIMNGLTALQREEEGKEDNVRYCVLVPNLQGVRGREERERGDGGRERERLLRRPVFVIHTHTCSFVVFVLNF